LGVGERGGKRHNTTLATKVNNALTLDEFRSPGYQQHQAADKRKKMKSDLKVGDDLAARVSAKTEEGDVRGAVRLAVSDDVLAPCCDAVADALRLLHPPCAAPTNGSTSPPQPDIDTVNSSTPSVLMLSAQDIVEAIKSFPTGSAGGLDGLRPQHLKDMTSPYTGLAGERLVATLTEFANMCLAGRVPPAVHCSTALRCVLSPRNAAVFDRSPSVQHSVDSWPKRRVDRCGTSSLQSWRLRNSDSVFHSVRKLQRTQHAVF